MVAFGIDLQMYVVHCYKYNNVLIDSTKICIELFTLFTIINLKLANIQICVNFSPSIILYFLGQSHHF